MPDLRTPLITRSSARPLAATAFSRRPIPTLPMTSVVSNSRIEAPIARSVAILSSLAREVPSTVTRTKSRSSFAMSAGSDITE